jgi:hypothetical protein
MTGKSIPRHLQLFAPVHGLKTNLRQGVSSFETFPAQQILVGHFLQSRFILFEIGSRKAQHLARSNPVLAEGSHDTHFGFCKHNLLQSQGQFQNPQADLNAIVRRLENRARGCRSLTASRVGSGLQLVATDFFRELSGTDLLFGGVLLVTSPITLLIRLPLLLDLAASLLKGVLVLGHGILLGL